MEEREGDGSNHTTGDGAAGTTGEVFGWDDKYKCRGMIKVTGLFDFALDIHQSPESRYDSHGTILWRGAYCMAHYLKFKADIYWNNASVIELGAGTGLVGLVVSLMGAHVVVTDLDQQLLELQQKNFEMYENIIAHFEIYKWGDDIDLGKFEYIIGAELLQYDACYSDLVKSLDELSDEKTTIYLVYERRRPQVEVQFFELLAKKFIFHLSSDIGPEQYKKYPLILITAYKKPKMQKQQPIDPKLRKRLEERDWDILLGNYTYK